MLRKKGLSEKYALTEVESFLMLFFDLNQIGKAVFTKKLFHLELLRNALFEEIKEIIVLNSAGDWDELQKKYFSVRQSWTKFMKQYQEIKQMWTGQENFVVVCCGENLLWCNF